ncbi:MAG TPA: NADH-quinone oxidoreductase subunit NuoG, partial [Patescibacteria group bacterium]|nr:NADH-quinone oxidoreductase subunit NuoG [Patescibacteria group bacterium]
MPKLTINGIEIEVPPGTSILQAAEQLGIEIPRFCYHDRLSVPANCRMCLVEVAPGPPKPQASCALACADGMTVKTESDMAKKARKGVMEFLLINHPLDCPICDQGGECDLQDQAMAYGFDRSRYAENKRAVPDKNFGPLIKTSMNRCIQCTRCVRFGEEIAGVPDLGLLNRGEDVEISTFIGKAVGSELSANMIDVCPVGALTSKPYAFMARPWELTKTESVDVMDAVGSNIRVDSRGGEVLRILPRLHEDINEEWISDKTRYACDGLKVRRLDRPWLKIDGKLKEVSWDEVLAAAASKLRNTKPEKIIALTGAICASEELVALKDLMGTLGVENVSGLINGLRINTSSRAAYIANTGIANLEKADAVLLIGTNPRWEAAMINARIRKAWRNNRAKIALVGPECDLNYPYTHIGEGPADLEALASGKHAFAATLKNAKNPIIILGAGALEREDGEAVHALAASVAEALGVIRPDWNGFNVLHYNAAQVAALDLGLTAALSNDDKQGAEVVYLLNVDGPVVNTLPRKAFAIYQGHHGDAGAHRADLILPGAAYTEKNGTYVNTEGRVQIGRKAADAPGQAREDWKILRALSGVLGKALPYDDLPQLRARIVKEWPSFGAIDMQPAEQWKKLPAPIKGMKGDFKPVIENFYLTNSIARA